MVATDKNGNILGSRIADDYSLYPFEFDASYILPDELRDIEEVFEKF